MKKYLHIADIYWQTTPIYRGRTHTPTHTHTQRCTHTSELSCVEWGHFEVLKNVLPPSPPLSAPCGTSATATTPPPPKHTHTHTHTHSSHLVLTSICMYECKHASAQRTVLPCVTAALKSPCSAPIASHRKIHALSLSFSHTSTEFFYMKANIWSGNVLKLLWHTDWGRDSRKIFME